jgi:cytochrome P450
MTVHADFTS